MEVHAWLMQLPCLQAAGGMVADMVGVHARQISDTAHEPYSQPCDDPVTDMVATTLHAWRQPVSPHLAVQREGNAAHCIWCN